jgi:hydroxyacylglutathione hydrolase
LERRRNPKLQYATREAFIAATARELERPPYFDRMEAWNIKGPPLLSRLKTPAPMSAERFDQSRAEAFVLDTRDTLAFSAAHVPKSLSIWFGGLASFAGWYLDYDQPLLLLPGGEGLDPVVRTLRRLGYDNVTGCLGDGMLGWHTAGKESSAIETITVQSLCRQLDAGQDHWVLDVRSDRELEQDGEILGAHHIHITQLPAHLDDVPRARRVTIFCGSGLRSTIAASLLQGAGWRELAVVLGGLSGWNSVSCPIEIGG